MKHLMTRAAQLVGQHVDMARFDDASAGGAVVQGRAQFVEHWQRLGLDGLPKQGMALSPEWLPAVAWLTEGAPVLLKGRAADGLWMAETCDGLEQVVAEASIQEWVSLPHRSAHRESCQPSAFERIQHVLRQHRRIFLEAGVATAVCNLLTLGTSLFSMQVYDRVIPNQGFYTLWVLSVGVVVALMLEFVLKQVRSRSVDRACHAMDVTLSGWFFQRMMGVRMESRPASVGSLASQIKGFELVRGILASTSLFVLTDVPFALFFIGVIALVGGWLALIPLLLVPCAVSAGVLFQRAIQRHTRLNLNASHRKTGLLVESVDGAESLKAQGAEWTLLRRWMNLADEAGEADQHIRGLNAWSQNITVALQQLAYVGLVAAGAWLVAHNELTMGGLLACTIISNRAMMPIVQLPGVMVQWAHARAALEGLDQVIRLPNEADDVVHALQPQRVEGSLRFDRVRFAYGVSPRPALELQGLAIKPGERVGVLGAIGSGKSTLLKMASGLYRPAEGRVFIGGLDQSLLSSAVVRSVVGYLPQDARLVSGTLRDNLLQGLPDPGDEVILSAAQRTGLIELINAQPRGLSLPITEGGRGVSGGQKQLIMLTRLLLARPAIWLMDEPTGAMDSMTEAKVVQLLSDVAKDGATVVAATHKTALLPLFDRLIILQNGRVLADGPRDVILAKMQGKAQV